MEILAEKREEFQTAGYGVFEPVSHTKLVQFVQNQNIVKLASYFRQKLEILKYSREVSLIILVDIECTDYSWIFDCRVSRFLNNRARESGFL